MKGGAILQPLFRQSCEWRAPHVIICPFAGGSMSAFRQMRCMPEQACDISVLVYPGRDHRMKEPCKTTIAELADGLVEHLVASSQEPERPLVLVGHSMGAQVAFEACTRLEVRGQPPAMLVLSACHAPHQRGRRLLSGLGDRAFLAELADIGGGAQTLVAAPDLAALFMPMLRADFQATEGYYRPMPVEKLKTRTLLLHGNEDREASFAEVNAWHDWLEDAAGPVQIAGDHFYPIQVPDVFFGHVLSCFHALRLGRQEP